MRTELAVEAPCLQMLLAISSMLSASCLKPPASAQAIGEFKSPPQALVAANSATRDFAGTNASLAADLVRLAEGTTPRSQTPVAHGLAHAAKACGSVDQQACQALAGDLSTAVAAAAAASVLSSAGPRQNRPPLHPTAGPAVALPLHLPHSPAIQRISTDRHLPLQQSR